MHWGGLLSPAVTSPQAQERERERSNARLGFDARGSEREREREPSGQGLWFPKPLPSKQWKRSYRQRVTTFAIIKRNSDNAGYYNMTRMIINSDSRSIVLPGGSWCIDPAAAIPSPKCLARQGSVNTLGLREHFTTTQIC